MENPQDEFKTANNELKNAQSNLNNANVEVARLGGGRQPQNVKQYVYV